MNQAFSPSENTLQKNIICIYQNSRGELGIQQLVNATLRETGTNSLLQGWSVVHERPITLRTDRIIQTFDSLDEAESTYESGEYPINAPITLPDPTRLSSPNTMDICFTGFDKEEKQQLTAFAEKHGMIVRKSVTRHLNILCFGKSAGPSKLAQANSQGVLILNKDQLENLVTTGELPDLLESDIQLKESTPRKKIINQEDLVSTANAALSGLKEFSRRENLIAIFENSYAVGWKFKVHEVFKEALDIRLTPITINSKVIQTWTQGHAYSFKRGDSIGSIPVNNWKELLENDGIILQVAFANPAGFEENQRLDGTFNGTFYQSKSHKTAKVLEDASIEVSSYIYDSGILTVDIFKVNEEKSAVYKFDTISLSQVDFVTLLQQGYYWTKPLDADDDTPVEKVVLVP
ncbi:BRCT domain-containing protein [Vibrio navarrensis]|uniref:BRCT domain-containing protein n=1 Tax=Vibrio navarrensis TaxID=29495 RepID=UPI00155860FA|nr:BRCT domain-containing protein [Vibrio navarrensis]